MFFVNNPYADTLGLVIGLVAQLATRLPDLAAGELKSCLAQLYAEARRAARGLREIVLP